MMEVKNQSNNNVILSEAKDLTPCPKYGVRFLATLGMTLVGLVFFFIPTLVQSKPGATLFLDPETDSIVVEEVKTLALKANTGPDTINAIEATVSYPTHQIEIVSIAKGSLLKIWAQEPAHDSKKGTIKFAGGITAPGFKGESIVLVLKIKARTAGDIPIVITTGAILANDGKGTNVLSSLGGGLYRAEAKQILPEIVEEPVLSKVSEIRKTSEIVPSPPPQSSPIKGEEEKDISPPLVGGVRGGGQGEGGTVPSIPTTPSITAEDREPPQTFTVQVFEGERTACTTPTLMFQTSDAGSGLARYTVSLDNRELGSISAATHTGLVKLPELSSGLHTVVVIAQDRAGNTLPRSASLEIQVVPAPKIEKAPRRIKPTDTLQIWGSTLADAAIEGTLTKAGEIPLMVNVLVNKQGEWYYVHPNMLAEGQYVLEVVARERCGAVSSVTTVKFRVTSEGYFAPITKSFNRAIEATPVFFKPITVSFKRTFEATPEFFQPITSSFKTVLSALGRWFGR